VIGVSRRLRALYGGQLSSAPAAELTVTLASLTRHNNNNNNEYDIAALRPIKLAAIGASWPYTTVTLLLLLLLSPMTVLLTVIVL